MTYVSPEEEIGTQLFGTWALTEYAESYEKGVEPEPIEDYEWLYDSETAAGSYIVFRGDYTSDNCSVFEDKSGNYYSSKFWVETEDGVTKVIEEETTGATCEYELVEQNATTLKLRLVYDDDYGYYEIELTYEKVDFDPVNSDDFMLDKSSSGGM